MKFRKELFISHLQPRSFIHFIQSLLEYAIAQLVEAMRYKPENGGFDSRWGQPNFSLTSSFRPHDGVDSASNKNE